jgi:SOS-response transcriptional repressor LexA
MDAIKSKTRKQLYRYILSFKRGHCGESPTIREMLDVLPVRSTSVVAHHLQQLEKSGHILRYGSRIELNGYRVGLVRKRPLRLNAQGRLNRRRKITIRRDVTK